MTDQDQKIKELEATIADYKSQVEKTLSEQQESAKLLIRRDLALTKANEQLQALDAVKSEFISIAAHQLRTPLSAIKWIIHMLAHEEFKDVAERSMFIEKAAESTDRMIELVNDLLEADHIQSGKYQFVFAEVAADELINGIVGELKTIADERKITIETDLVSATAVRGDAMKLRALFQNLIENAIKYTLPGGKVKVSSVKETDYLKVSVSDSGIGIPDAQKNHIFSKFFRASNAVRVDTVGSGLGLFIAKEVVQRHGGNIWFESKTDVGTTFYVELPLNNKNN
jgi:two-component system sensor histidine kinase VicK